MGQAQEGRWRGRGAWAEPKLRGEEEGGVGPRPGRGREDFWSGFGPNEKEEKRNSDQRREDFGPPFGPKEKEDYF